VKWVHCDSEDIQIVNLMQVLSITVFGSWTEDSQPVFILSNASDVNNAFTAHFE
jgi:hypothetical protein